jgi:hypothetical protein
MATEPTITGGFFENIPAIISAAAQSILGILALIIIALSLLAYVFFKNETAKVKIVIFILLFLGTVGFGYAVLQSAENFNSDGIEPGVTTYSFVSGFPVIDSLIKDKMEKDHDSIKSIDPKFRIQMVYDSPGTANRTHSSNGFMYFYNKTKVNIKFNVNEKSAFTVDVIVSETDPKPHRPLAMDEYKKNYEKSILNNIDKIYDAIKRNISK